MNRIKKVFVLIHTVLWILFTLLSSLQLSQNNSNWRSLTVGFILTCLYAFYSNFFLLSRYSRKNKKASYYLSLAAIILTGPFIYLLFYNRAPDSPNSFFEQYVINLVSYVLPFIFLSWLARVTQNLVINTFKKEQLEKQAVEAELYYLKSQINPHFLFNTLNNIHTLVYKQAPAAPDAVMQLASLMRYMIYESNSPTVPLTREMEYLEDYVNLQQLRYKQGPVVDLKIVGKTEACRIAPLLFVHLLENAYKHSPTRLNPGDIKIIIEVIGDNLTFSLKNPVGKQPANTFDEHGGIGLPNVKKRLALLYPEKHTLEIHNDGDVFELALKIHGLQLFSDERKTHLLHH
jgi:Histidine kinase